MIGIEPHRPLPVFHTARQSSSEFILSAPVELRLPTVSVLVGLVSPHPCPSQGPLPSRIPREYPPPQTHTQLSLSAFNHSVLTLPLPLLFGCIFPMVMSLRRSTALFSVCVCVFERDRERWWWGDRKKERKAQVSGFPFSVERINSLFLIYKEGENSRKGETLGGNLSCWCLFLSPLSPSSFSCNVMTRHPKHSYTQLSTKCMPPDQSLYPLSSIDKVIRDVAYLFFVLMIVFASPITFFLSFCDVLLTTSWFWLHQTPTHLQFKGFPVNFQFSHFCSHTLS